MSTGTRDQILDVAERLVQLRGFNGFSYADIAVELKIKKASVHHHFPTKADLGRKLVQRHQVVFDGLLDAIDRETSNWMQKLARYTSLYKSVLENENRMCLCGMLAADFATLPVEIRAEVHRFFDANELWLASVLAEGRKAAVLNFEESPESAAFLLLSSLQGAMLVARSYEDPVRFAAIADRLLSRFSRSARSSAAHPARS